MNKKRILAVLIVPTVLLLIPLAGNAFVEDWDWGPGAFVFAWVMMAGGGFAYLSACGAQAQRTRAPGSGLSG